MGRKTGVEHNMKVVMPLSGGLDSVTLLHYLLEKGATVKCLGFSYGQIHGKELQYAQAAARECEADYEEVDLTKLSPLISAGPLTGHGPVPNGHYEDESMKAMVVPNRNMIFLAIAVAHAITIGYDTVAYGAHDHKGDTPIYIDGSVEFIKRFQAAVEYCDYKKIIIYTPFTDRTKAGIVKTAAELGVELDTTWSCYKGGRYHCGKCGTCVERKEAFAEAGEIDTTIYEE